MPDTAQSRAQRRLGASVVRRMKNCTVTFAGGQLSGVLVDTMDTPVLGEMSLQARLLTVRVTQADADARSIAPKEKDAVTLVSLVSGVSSARKVQSVEADRNTSTIKLVLSK